MSPKAFAVQEWDLISFSERLIAGRRISLYTARKMVSSGLRKLLL
jgi:hypothetical protein